MNLVSILHRKVRDQSAGVGLAQTHLKLILHFFISPIRLPKEGHARKTRCHELNSGL
jgi:hypothetical protein